MIAPMPCPVREVGIESSTSRSSTCIRAADCTSTTDDSPDTVTLSSSAPTESSTFTVAVKSAGSSSSSRMTVPKPGSEKVTV